MADVVKRNHDRFRRLDSRLAAFILEKSEEGGLKLTHQKIAEDLGSTREVISRILKDFENRGIISQSRGFLQIEAPEDLGTIISH